MTFSKDEMPFDINAPIIEIPPEDYGIWFVDAMDNPDKYVDKIVRFKRTCHETTWNGINSLFRDVWQ